MDSGHLSKIDISCPRAKVLLFSNDSQEQRFLFSTFIAMWLRPKLLSAKANSSQEHSSNDMSRE